MIYAPGYYNCYTLAVNLSSVCDISRGAVFVASPNDPTITNCVCPAGAECATQPIVDLRYVSKLIARTMLPPGAGLWRGGEGGGRGEGRQREGRPS